LAPRAPKRRRATRCARYATFASVLLRRVALRWGFALVCGVGYLILRLLVMCERGGAWLGLPPLVVAGEQSTPRRNAAEGLLATLYHVLASGEWRSATLETSGLLRKAENPFAFLESKLSKGLSLAYLQARWAQLLLFPQQLCAEYSFNCIPPIDSLLDPRNLATLALAVGSAMLLFIACGASRRQGARVLRCTRRKRHAHAAETAAARAAGQLVKMANARWRRQQHALRVAIAITVLPHLPGSNLITPVGTLIAERLLYIPSIGFVLGGAVLWQMREDARDGEPGGAARSRDAARAASAASAALAVKAATGGARKERAPRDGVRGEGWTVRQLRIAAILALVFSWCAQRTWMRTIEWSSDLALFTSGVEACPESAKMHQQLGQILFNRHTEKVRARCACMRVCLLRRGRCLAWAASAGAALVRLRRLPSAASLLPAHSALRNALHRTLAPPSTPPARCGETESGSTTSSARATSSPSRTDTLCASKKLIRTFAKSTFTSPRAWARTRSCVGALPVRARRRRLTPAPASRLHRLSSLFSLSLSLSSPPPLRLLPPFRYYARAEIGQIHRAMSLFRKNLNCVFSNAKSFLSLQRVWQFRRHRKTPGVPPVPLLNHPRMWGDNATLIVEMASTWGVIGSATQSRPLWSEAGSYLAGRALAAKVTGATYLDQLRVQVAEGREFGETEAGGANEILRVVRRVLLTTVAAEVEEAVVHARTAEGRWNKSAVESDGEQHIAAWVQEQAVGAQLRADLFRIGRDPQEPAKEIAAAAASLEHVHRLAAHGAIAMFSQVVAASESNCTSNRYDTHFFCCSSSFFCLLTYSFVYKTVELHLEQARLASQAAGR
jgi:hypothetical protein